MAQFTERALADTLKELMETEKLDRITVRQVVERCGVNRKTFYYHFSGIHALLEWMLDRDLRQVIGEDIRIGTWQQDMLRTLYYIRDNRRLFDNICRSRYWPETRLYLGRLLDGAMYGFAQEALAVCRSRTGEPLQLQESDFRVIVHFYSTAMFVPVEEWFLGGMQEPPEKIPERLDMLLNESMFDTFRRFAAAGGRAEAQDGR